MAVTYTWNATYTRIEVAGDLFTGTSSGGNTLTRIYFPTSTFTAGQFDGRVFNIISGTGSNANASYKIKNTGTNYLDIQDAEFYYGIPDSTSAIEIKPDLKLDILPSAANTASGNRVSILQTGLERDTVLLDDVCITAMNNTHISIKDDVICHLPAAYTMASTQFFQSQSYAGLIVGYGDMDNKVFANTRIHIECKLEAYPSYMYFLGGWASAYIMQHNFFNVGLSGNLQSYFVRPIGQATSSVNFVDVNFSNNKDAAINSPFVAGSVTNMRLENMNYNNGTVGTTTIDNLSMIITRSGVSTQYVVNHVTANIAKIKNLTILDSPYHMVLANIFYGTSGLEIRNVKFPTGYVLDTSKFLFYNDGAFTKIFSTFNLHLKDENGDPMNGATVNLYCEDDHSLDILGLTTDIDGNIAEQDLLYRYFLRISGSVVDQGITDTWKLEVTKSGYSKITEIETINGLAVIRELGMTPIDTTPPSWTITTGIQSFVDTQLGGTVHFSCGTATDTESNPVSYNVYLQESTDVDLFTSGNRIKNSLSTSDDIVYPFDNTKTYYMGIRAQDAIGNEDTNTVSISLANIIPQNKILTQQLTDIETKVDTIDTVVDAIQVETDKIPSIKTETDKIQTIDDNVDQVLVDTGNIEGKVDSVKLDTTDLKAGQVSIDSDLTNIEGKVDIVDANIDLIKPETDKIQGVADVTSDTNTKVDSIIVDLGDADVKLDKIIDDIDKVLYQLQNMPQGFGMIRQLILEENVKHLKLLENLFKIIDKMKNKTPKEKIVEKEIIKEVTKDMSKEERAKFLLEIDNRKKDIKTKDKKIINFKGIIKLLEKQSEVKDAVIKKLGKKT